MSGSLYSGNIVEGNNNKLISSGSRVIGNGNIHIGANSNINADNTKTVGNNQNININGLHMFGTKAHPYFWQNWLINYEIYLILLIK